MHLLALVLACLLPALALPVLISVVAHQSLSSAAHDRAVETAITLAAAVDVTFEQSAHTLTVLADAADNEPGEYSAEFSTLLRQAADISGTIITLRSVNGQILLSSQPNAARRPSEPSWFKLAQIAVQDRMAVVGHVSVADNSSMTVVTLLLPVVRDNVPIFMLEMMLPVDQLIATLRQRGPTTNGLVVLVDETRRIAAASNSVARLVGQTFPNPDTESADELPPATAELHARPIIEARLKYAQGWRLIYLEDTHPITIPWLSATTWGAALVVLIFGLTLTILASRRMVTWLQQLSTLTRSMAVGSHAPLESTSRAQVAELEELRQSMLRADAVLRRRGAAERMALREARTGHELLVSVVNGTAESIHVKDLELRYVLVNRAALENPGANGGPPHAEWQVLGRQTADLFPPLLARRIESADRRVLATGQMISFELEYTRGSETKTRWLAMTIAPWQDAEGRVVGVVSVSRDVTQKRQSEMRLRKLQAELLRVTRLSAMGAMASGLAHELNQPLAAATNYLNAGSRLLERSSAGDEAALLAVRGAVGDAAQQMLRAGAIVRRLRDFVERGEVELQPENVAELLRETCDLATTDGHCEGIELKCTIAEGIGSMLVDRTQIGQVLFNLIRNAAEAIQGVQVDHPPGEVFGQITVNARVATDGHILIEVIDSGPGLAPGIAERLFEPFVSSKRTGMGIGLAICRTIVEGHGGMLTAVPNPTGGMIFRISLPALLPQGVAA